MFKIIRWGNTNDKSPATQSFNVGSINNLLILPQLLLRPDFKSFNVCIIGLESPKTLAILAIDSPYSLVFVTGSVSVTLLIKAKLELFDLISFNEWPFTHI